MRIKLFCERCSGRAVRTEEGVDVRGHAPHGLVEDGRQRGQARVLAGVARALLRRDRVLHTSHKTIRCK